MNNSLFYSVNLLAAMNTRPSRHGDRRDKKICDAKPGEYRYNSKYYTPGMGDQKSWSLPSSDDSCPDTCCYLIKGE
jgi:hypothetical protein